MLALPAATLALNVIDAGAHTASKLLPIENKDSFFSAPPLYYGVFDGVSQCPESRAYSQMVAKSTMAALQRGGGGDWETQAREAMRAGAAKACDYSGASTALAVKLDLDGPEPCVRTFSIGDCQVMILREETPGTRTVVDYSDVQFHSNGAPYQLAGANWQTDMVEDGKVESFAVADGDVVLAFSDGFANNFNLEEVGAAVQAASRLSAEAMAKTLVEQARDRKRVNDDVTVVALKVGSGAWVGGDASAVTSADGGFDPLVALADFKPLKKFNPFGR